jgi:hypothetical protein
VKLFFKWNPLHSDTGVTFDDDKLIAYNQYGYGSALGDKEMKKGGRYSFTVKYIKNDGCYIGVATTSCKINGIFSQS